MRITIITVVLSLAITSLAGETTTDKLRGLLGSTAQLTGTNYIQQRNQIVNLGTNVVPLLKQLQATNETWQVQLMAGICRERLERENEIKAMSTKDWRKDPGWDKNWDYGTPNVPTYTCGPIEVCKTLMVKRYREAGLWYCYIELFWKDTGERPNVGPDMNAREWNDLSLTVLEGSPAVEFVARIMEDGMLKAGALSQYSVQYIVRNKVHSSLPALIAAWAKGKQDTVPLFVFQTVLDLADTNDLNCLKAFIQDHPTAAHIDFVKDRIRAFDAAIGNAETNHP